MPAQTMLRPVDGLDHPTFKIARPERPSTTAVAERSVYASRRLDPISGIAAVLVAAAAFTSFQYLGNVPHKKLERSLTVLTLLDPPKPPPPETPPIQKAQPTPRVQPAIVAPLPIVASPAPPSNLAVTDMPAPPAPAPVKVAEAPPAPPSLAPTDAGDLSSKMISATPPSYPVESRRLHEQGTVVLSVALSLDGRVNTVSVAKSSGFYRLDRAASGAVRHWRWSPTVRDGVPVLVQGNVVIPFVLNT